MTDLMNPPDAPLFEEFPAPTHEEWVAAALEALGGASFEKTLTTPTDEGLTLQPLYRRDAIAGITHPTTLPGFPPYVRGTSASGYVGQPWSIAQELPCPTPETFNAALREDLAGGQDAIRLILDQATRSGLDPDQAAKVGYEGLSLATLDDFAAAFDGIDLTGTPLHVSAGTSALPLAALLAAYLHSKGQSIINLRGSIAADPLGELVQTGTLPLALDACYAQMAQITAWAVEQTPQVATIAIDSTPYHQGGANAVQELAFAIATGTEYVREMLRQGLQIEDITPRMRFTFAIGGHFFMEVAKLRAARLLWSQVIAAFGGSANVQRMQLHARTGTLNKTVADPYTNLLRTTLEAFAGVLGGSAELSVTPFDAAAHLPDEFSRRIARNQQLVLRHESNLTTVVDPAGGSYYVEALTDALARQSWTLFQEVERQGGLFSALKVGFPQEHIAAVAQKRKINFARRRDVLVGINRYPNPTEGPPLQPDAINAAAHHEARARTAAADRQRRDHTQVMRALHQLEAAPPSGRIQAAVEAARAGATLNEITRALRAGSVEPAPTVIPIPPFRLAEPFETLRRNAEAFRVRTGTLPRIFLANVGSDQARADFSTAFFEVGGFEIMKPGGFDTSDGAAQAALDSGAPVVVICSTDNAYPHLVPPLTQRIKTQQPQTVVLLAGYPQDQIEAHQAAGVDGFIHVRSDCYEVNDWLQAQIGVRA